jgi:WXG100 family type VII secretion target
LTQYTVTPAYIAQAALDCHARAADIQNQLAILQNYVIDIGAEWLGVASTTFENMMTNWRAYATLLHNALDDIGSGLQGNFINYVAVEESTIASIVEVEGVLPPINLAPVPVGPTVAPGDFEQPVNSGGGWVG